MAAADASRKDEAATHPILIGVKSLFGNERYSDYTMECEGRKWRIHKAIICPQSEVLAKACDGDFREGIAQCYIFNGVVADAVNAMLSYFYTHDYHDEESRVMLNVRVCYLAQQYLCTPLKDLACKKLSSCLSNGWAGEDLVLAIETVYGIDPDGESGVKTCLLEVVREHLDELLSDAEKYADFHATGRKTPSFLMDILVGRRHLVHSEADARASHVARVNCRNHEFCMKLGPVPLVLSSVASRHNVLLRCPSGSTGCCPA
ncbi:hypothetical protein B0A48_13031 [Cryoendolithus antarcticus]|uniref:BTB domain-containing protein n=1 Tax=Cryoendolithus antarcticus TaxID=1507870 RepID=A0A1V8SQN3_9PEZI|nr:hypothetical protein B0A48_13031 [Cryoendolithus antarcticus]